MRHQKMCIPFFVLVVLNLALCYAQQNKKSSAFLLKSTLTRVSSSSISSTLEGKNYLIQQSIGQTGITGTVKIKHVTVQQGFLTNTMFSINTEEPVANMGFTVLPNPIKDYLNIYFLNKPISKVYIRIFDVSGKLCFNNVYMPKKELNIPISTFSKAVYILQIITDTTIHEQKIIKE